MVTDKHYRLSVKVILIDSTGKCLLLKRSNSSRNNPGKWDLPGGKMEIGEEFETVVIREVMEETGLEIRLLGLAGSILSESPDYHVVNVIMTGRAPGEGITLSSEHEDYGWFFPEQIEQIDIIDHLQEVVMQYYQSNPVPGFLKM